MSEKLYILIISGPAASGKSTVAKALWNLLPNAPAYICLDSLKHMVKNASSTDHYLDLASQNALALMKNFLNAGHSVIISKAFCKYSYVKPFVKEGAKRQINVYYFKLVATLAELLKRNITREHYILEDRLREIYDFHKKHQHSQGIELDTEYFSVSQIVEFIKITINNKKGTLG